MFLKAFLVFNCLILHTTSRPTSQANLDIQHLNLLKSTISSALNSSKINCNSTMVSAISLSHKDNLCETYQYKFCQISKALNASSCIDSNVKDLQALSNHLKGKGNCTLPDNHGNIQIFLEHLKEYRRSLQMHCPKN